MLAKGLSPTNFVLAKFTVAAFTLLLTLLVSIFAGELSFNRTAFDRVLCPSVASKKDKPQNKIEKLLTYSFAYDTMILILASGLQENKYAHRHSSGLPYHRVNRLLVCADEASFERCIAATVQHTMLYVCRFYIFTRLVKFTAY